MALVDSSSLVCARFSGAQSRLVSFSNLAAGRGIWNRFGKSIRVAVTRFPASEWAGLNVRNVFYTVRGSE
jgi:hypothetical protein